MRNFLLVDSTFYDLRKYKIPNYCLSFFVQLLDVYYFGMKFGLGNRISYRALITSFRRECRQYLILPLKRGNQNRISH